jgi:hypothetical protein
LYRGPHNKKARTKTHPKAIASAASFWFKDKYHDALKRRKCGHWGGCRRAPTLYSRSGLGARFVPHGFCSGENAQLKNYDHKTIQPAETVDAFAIDLSFLFQKRHKQPQFQFRHHEAQLKRGTATPERNPAEDDENILSRDGAGDAAQPRVHDARPVS